MAIMFNHVDGGFDIEGCSYTLHQKRATVINGQGVRVADLSHSDTTRFINLCKQLEYGGYRPLPRPTSTLPQEQMQAIATSETKG